MIVVLIDTEFNKTLVTEFSEILRQKNDYFIATEVNQKSGNHK